MKKALLSSNTRLKKQVEEKTVWRTSTAIALPGGSALSLAKGRGRRRLTPEEEAAIRKRLAEIAAERESLLAERAVKLAAQHGAAHGVGWIHLRFPTSPELVWRAPDAASGACHVLSERSLKAAALDPRRRSAAWAASSTKRM